MFSKSGNGTTKSYAMQRMVAALGRAIASETNLDKDRASRWAAAWGLLAGIRCKGVRLRRYALEGEEPRERRGTPRPK